mmetsp:Transcript_3639/g.4026  ORF Transcript_3639/g.4026 Transcript_3639/m.4026 type:complete len:218 (-) Transcript_3639:56-709(-)|eukprot:CAMPEP_0168524408 /NCGR_PEP_ID=MMETSP0405-20121227/10629_1 /TAXON_ID=498012 /ORGANISM="Trichosphaerium sp, Strain Am-I-7 wt" /LENGTH=217 /DNA_ID=CAMNT_0008546603 /DNA_START=49 /DNA_END=702 /DNA_ORIENTATION=-
MEGAQEMMTMEALADYRWAVQERVKKRKKVPRILVVAQDRIRVLDPKTQAEVGSFLYCHIPNFQTNIRFRRFLFIHAPPGGTQRQLSFKTKLQSDAQAVQDAVNANLVSILERHLVENPKDFLKQHVETRSEKRKEWRQTTVLTGNDKQDFNKDSEQLNNKRKRAMTFNATPKQLRELNKTPDVGKLKWLPEDYRRSLKQNRHTILMNNNQPRTQTM